MSNSSKAISLHIRSELQYDYLAQVTPFQGDTLSMMSMTVSRNKDRFLNMYFIQGKDVYNAYQSHERVPTGSPPWSVESMHFEPTRATPILVRALGLVDHGLADWICVVSDTNDVYLLDTSKKYPTWNKLPSLDSRKRSNAQILDVSLFLASNTVPHVSVVTKDNRMFLLNPDSLDEDEWYEDISIRDWFGSGVLAHASSGAFALPPNKSFFGYLIAGAKGTPGLTILTGRPYQGSRRGQTVFKTVVDSGTSYNTVRIASMPAFTIPSYPLIFAIDKAMNAYYFQVKDTDTKDPQFMKVPILTGIKVKDLTACFRTSEDPVTGAAGAWIEVFALDAFGKSYHMESLADSLVLHKNGHYTVTAWGDCSPLSSESSAIVGMVSYDGMAYLAEHRKSQSKPAVDIYTQDPQTTNWKVNSVMLPAPLEPEADPPVTKQHVYYVVATVVDDEGYPLPGRAAVISSSQNAVININGQVKSVDSVHTASVLTNGAGQISLTLVAEDSLSIPIFTLWAEGMDPNIVVDVKPNGPIQSRIYNMTLEQARQARDNDAPGRPLFFPKDQYSDDDVKQALTTMKHSLNITDPSFASERNRSLETIDHGSPIRRYLHPKTHSAVARTRSRSAPSLAYCNGCADFGIEVTYFPTFHVRIFKAGEGPPVADFGLWSAFKGALGDIWHGVKKGFNQVVSTVVEGAKNAINATVKFIKEGAQYVWNGVVHAVETGFHLVDLVFNTVKKTFNAVFGWFGMLLDFGPIHRSADKFRTVLLDFPQFAKGLFGTTLPGITRGATGKTKAWVTKAFNDVQGLLAQGSVGQYSNPSLIPHSNASSLEMSLASGNGNILDELPSTAFWLINKIFDALKNGCSGQINLESSLKTFDELWDKLWKTLESLDLTVDLMQLVADLGKIFKDFNSRNAFDGVLWIDLLRAVKDIVFILIDVAEEFVLAAEYLTAEAINFFLELLNVPLNIPVISFIFKKVIGKDMTIINVVAYLVAIPFTFLYKLITGDSDPFADSKSVQSSALSTAQALSVAKGAVMLVKTYYITALNGIEDEVDVLLSKNFGNDVFPPLMSRIINGVSLCIPIICFGLAGYPSLQDGSVPSIIGWVVELAPAAPVLWHLIKTRSTKTVSMPSNLTDWVIFAIGGIKLGYAIYKSIVYESGPGQSALLASYWFTPWPSFAQPLRMLAVDYADPVDAQFILAAKAVVTQVCGYGEAISFIIANTRSDSATPLAAIEAQVRGTVDAQKVEDDDEKKGSS